jgi:hypothetical protein
MPAEGAEKQREAGLVARARDRQVSFGNAYEDMMAIARRLHNAFGNGEKLDEEQSISAQWKDAQTRNEKELLETLILKAQLLVPQEQLWREMGYDAEQIEEFKALQDTARAQGVEDQSVLEQGRRAGDLELMGRLLGGGNGRGQEEEPETAGETAEPE